MKGYALEVQLIEWECKCKNHPHGVCSDPSSNKRQELRSSYFGSFGQGVKTKEQAFKKWDSIWWDFR